MQCYGGMILLFCPKHVIATLYPEGAFSHDQGHLHPFHARAGRVLRTNQRFICDQRQRRIAAVEADPDHRAAIHLARAQNDFACREPGLPRDVPVRMSRQKRLFIVLSGLFEKLQVRTNNF